MNADTWQNKDKQESHDKERDKEGSAKFGKWRKSYEDVYALRNAYRENIPEQVRASMAFEGEHVSIKI
jgi:hypothetical protein